MPTSFTNINDAVNTTFYFILVISVILLVGITAMMIYFVVRYRRSKNPVPAQVESHALLEITWTVIPTILVLAMFYYGWIGYKLMREVPDGALQVNATAQMWSWSFEYENGKRSPELYVPQGQPVKVNLQSRDVLHSFYAPAYMVKQDIVPGMINYVWFDPVELGTFDIFCAEYCGQRHSYMLSKIHVVPRDEFALWVEQGVEAVATAPVEGESGDDRTARLVRLGEQLSRDKGCNACHTVDGTRLVGPTYKGLFGRTETVVTDGAARQIVVDEDYVRRSILDPNVDIVESYQPLMPSQQGLVTDEEIEALIEYLRTL
jgi:cytochrome c oxidase subunit 2